MLSPTPHYKLYAAHFIPMKRIYWVVLLLVQGITTLAQIGAGGALGKSTMPTVSSVGRGDTLGVSSLPRCTASLTTCGVALPVNFLDFTGKRENAEYVGLLWKTTSEILNSGYWVQRSFGNANNFNPVFFVPAIVTAGEIKQYQTPDTNAYRGTTYYRLQQVDMDGKATYSKIISIDGYPAGNTLVAYPNPSRGLVYLQCPPTADGRPYDIRVYNSFGQILYEGRTTSVDLSSQANGTYIIECRQDKPLFTKVIVLR